MAMGEPIGYSTRLTQNNSTDGLYRNQQNNCARSVHIALMGDPTLRMHTVSPPSDVACTMERYTSLTWQPSTDDVVGYYVYRAKQSAGPYLRITSLPISETALRDSSGSVGDSYMVRAVKLESSASGTYYNASQGAFFHGDTLKVASRTVKLQVASEPRLRSVAQPQPGAVVTPTGESTNGTAPSASVSSAGGGQ